MVAVLHALRAAYLPFEPPDLRVIYGLGAAIAAIYLTMVLFRALGRMREARQVRRSSWRTFQSIAKVKGLSRVEIKLLAEIVRRARVKRPSQVLGAITAFDRVVDLAVDRRWVLDDDLVHLEAARNKLVRSAQKWDGHSNRRQFERATYGVNVQALAVTKDALDEELKTTYEESDEKFRQALDGLVAEGRGESTRLLDLSAGGLSLLAQDKDQFHPGDYLAFTEGGDPLPFDLTAIRGRLLDVDRMEDQRQLVLHVAFMPYDSEVRKQVIGAVYESAGRSSADRQGGKPRRPRRAAGTGPKTAGPKAAADSPAPADQAAGLAAARDGE